MLGCGEAVEDGSAPSDTGVAPAELGSDVDCGLEMMGVDDGSVGGFASLVSKNPGLALKYSITGPKSVLNDVERLCEILPSAHIIAHSSGT